MSVYCHLPVPSGELLAAEHVFCLLLLNTYSAFVSFIISRSLGGKLGASVIEVLGIEYMGELTQFTESQLQNHFGEKNG